MTDAQLIVDQGQMPVRVGAGEVLSVAARIRVDPYDLKHSSNSVTFVLQAEDDPDLNTHEEARFIGPAPAR